jgi:DNA-binding XRE family transcriptional regulator/predicted transcriptional regulator
MSGRPKDKAPSGHVTVSEAAELLGVTPQAIRNRMVRKTLPALAVPNQSGENRYYIPRASVEESLMRNSETQSLSRNQADVSELVARLDALSERQENIERLVAEVLVNPERQERPGATKAQVVTELQEQLKAEQLAREAAEKERDVLRMLICTTPLESEESLPQESSEVATEPASDSRVFDGRKMRRLRQARFLTQKGLSEESGVSRTTINQLEAEDGINAPRNKTLFSIASVLNVAPEELLVPVS